MSDTTDTYAELTGKRTAPTRRELKEMRKALHQTLPAKQSIHNQWIRCEQEAIADFYDKTDFYQGCLRLKQEHPEYFQEPTQGTLEKATLLAKHYGFSLVPRDLPDMIETGRASAYSSKTLARLAETWDNNKVHERFLADFKEAELAVIQARVCKK